MKTTTILALFVTSCLSLFATPTSLFWTNCTTDVLETKVVHFDFDNYFSVGNRTKNGSSFPPDIGLTYGLFTWNNISTEIGADYLGGIDDPWLFNGKLGLPENKLFEDSPAISLAIFDLGTSHDTNLCVVDAVIGKTLPKDLGTLYFGLFHGKRALGKHRSGLMCGYSKSFYTVKDEQGKDYSKWEFVADYSSHKNLIGGGGAGVVYYFTPKISVETGPVWFNDTKTNGRWKWSVQIDVNV